MLTIVRGILNTIKEENLAVSFTNQIEDIHKMEYYLNEVVQKENAKANGSGNLLKAVKAVLKRSDDVLNGVCKEDSEGRKYYTDRFMCIRAKQDLSIAKCQRQMDSAEQIFIDAINSNEYGFEIPTLKELKNMKDECRLKLKSEGRTIRDSRYIIKLADKIFNIDYIISAVEATGANMIYVNCRKNSMAYFRSEDSKVECVVMPINRDKCDNEGFENNTVRFSGTFR